MMSSAHGVAHPVLAHGSLASQLRDPYRDQRGLKVAAVATVLLLVTVALSWSISRSLVTRLRSVVTVMRRAADGDLSARLDVDGPDEIAS
ncbi:hypothetical protein GCM10010166_65780 [Couchioplanes caeruleus subsp. azureus]|nr:hypothetical protein GCM10010166_65780 [Couchioplanes caeruleus subsp. azureus]